MYVCVCRCSAIALNWILEFFCEKHFIDKIEGLNMRRESEICATKQIEPNMRRTFCICVAVPFNGIARHTKYIRYYVFLWWNSVYFKIIFISSVFLLFLNIHILFEMFGFFEIFIFGLAVHARHLFRMVLISLSLDEVRLDFWFFLQKDPTYALSQFGQICCNFCFGFSFRTSNDMVGEGTSVVLCFCMMFRRYSNTECIKFYALHVWYLEC